LWNCGTLFVLASGYGGRAEFNLKLKKPPFGFARGGFIFLLKRFFDPFFDKNHFFVAETWNKMGINHFVYFFRKFFVKLFERNYLRERAFFFPFPYKTADCGFVFVNQAAVVATKYRKFKSDH
jgi:hypothetical protein